MKNLNFILIGRSGCGKGTQAKLLLERFPNLFYISSGALFRKLAQCDTQVGHKIKAVIEKGELPFDDLAISLWMTEIAYNLKEEQGICLDGAPRRLEEAKALDHFLTYLNREKNTIVFLIDISKKEAFRRLLKRRICQNCGQIIPWTPEFQNLNTCPYCHGQLQERTDDTLQAIQERLDYFEKKVRPVIRYFQKKNWLVKINGEQSIEKVFADILKVINQYDTSPLK